MVCVSCIDRFKFLSGADEKILRIFEAPKIFLKNYYNLSKDESARELIVSQFKLFGFNKNLKYINFSRKVINYHKVQVFLHLVCLIKLFLRPKFKQHPLNHPKYV
jgi:hypothetical protein